MIDFVFGILTAGGIALLIAHFRAQKPRPLNGSPLTIAQTLLQGLELIVANSTQGLIGRIDSLDARVADHSADLAADLKEQIERLRADQASISARIDAIAAPR